VISVSVLVQLDKAYSIRKVKTIEVEKENCGIPMKENNSI
jgi:hypothetical protein